MGEKKNTNYNTTNAINETDGIITDETRLIILLVLLRSW